MERCEDDSLAQDARHWRTQVTTIIKHWVPQKARNFLTTLASARLCVIEMIGWKVKFKQGLKSQGISRTAQSWQEACSNCSHVLICSSVAGKAKIKLYSPKISLVTVEYEVCAALSRLQLWVCLTLTEPASRHYRPSTLSRELRTDHLVVQPQKGRIPEKSAIRFLLCNKCLTQYKIKCKLTWKNFIFVWPCIIDINDINTN